MDKLFEWGQSFFNSIGAIGDWLFSPTTFISDAIYSAEWLWKNIPIVNDFIYGIADMTAQASFAVLIGGTFLTSLLLFKFIKFIVDIVL